MIPDTKTRVKRHTDETVNYRIQREMEDRIAYYTRHRDEIDERLEALDREWDIERVLEANAAAFGFSGVMLGAFRHRGFLLLPAAVTAFLMQHATQGWCPPVPVLRRLGVRTMEEIDTERYALKALRGDFRRPALAPRHGLGFLHSLLRSVRL